MNLIVGGNGVGKTTVLEAIQVWSAPPWGSAIDLLLRRKEEIPGSDAELPLDYERLFWAKNGGSAPTLHLTLEASGDPKRSKVEMDVGWFGTEAAPSVRDVWIGANVSPAQRPHARRDVRVRLNGDPATDSCAGFEGLRYKDIYSNIGYRYLSEDLAGLPITFVRSDRDLKDLEQLWSETVLTDRHQHLREALRLLLPQLEDVNVVSVGGDPTVLVRLRDASHPVPLASLGEGLVSLFTIALSALQAANGILLIDEVENGLHFSAHEQVWRFLIAVAIQQNIQIFATTHSWDCIEAFQAASADSPGIAALIRLQRTEADIVPVVFHDSELAILMRSHMEVRW